MMAVVGLVGGLSVDMKQKFGVKAEERLLSSIVTSASQRAFILDERIELHVNTNKIDLMLRHSNTPFFSEEFSELTFNKQKVVFDSQGLPSTTAISYDTKNRAKTLTLESLFNDR